MLDGSAGSAVREKPLPEAPGLQILRKICDGGMGTVYAARDIELQEIVAVKVLQPDLPADCQWEYAIRFEREIRIHAELPEHVNLVKCHRGGVTTCGQPLMVMDLVSGGDLCDFVLREGPMSVIDAVHVAQGVLRGLAHLEANGRIVHRDIKPENILLEPLTPGARNLEGGFVPKLADLGLAKGVRSEPITARGLAPPLSVRAAAPEIFTSPSQTDFRADLYGVGCVLFYALVGESPHEEPNPDVTVFRKLHYEAPPITDSAPHVPADLAEIVRRSLKRDPAKRYSSYTEMSTALEAVRERLHNQDERTASRNRRPVSAAEPGYPEPWRRRRGRPRERHRVL